MKNKSHRMADWIKKNWLVSMIVSAVVGAIVTWPLSWILPSPKVEVSNLPRKELTCTLNYGKPLFVRMTNDSDFKILFKDAEVKNPFLYSITIENTGSEPILNEDFTKPLTIDFGKSIGIVKASIIESSNQELWNEFLEKTSVEGTVLSLHDLFLNSGETCTVNVITDGKADVIRYDQRIVGIPNLTIRNTPNEKNEKVHTGLIIILIIPLFVAVSVPIFIFVEQRKFRKDLRESEEEWAEQERSWQEEMQQMKEEALKRAKMEETKHEPECEHK